MKEFDIPEPFERCNESNEVETKVNYFQLNFFILEMFFSNYICKIMSENNSLFGLLKFFSSFFL